MEAPFTGSLQAPKDNHRYGSIRKALMCLSLIVPCASLQLGPVWAAPGFEGRWEGDIAIPGAPQRLILDLDRDQGGRWIGSAILPGWSVKGAPVRTLKAHDSLLELDLPGVLQLGGAEPPRLTLRRHAGEDLAGDFRQAGLTAPIALVRSGAAQVEFEPQSSAVTSELVGTWRGQFDLGGYPRQVTLILRHGAGSAEADLTIVGKRTTQVPIDRIRQEGSLLEIVSKALPMSIEGRWQATRITGTVKLGPYELPMTLERDSGASVERSGS